MSWAPGLDVNLERSLILRDLRNVHSVYRVTLQSNQYG